MLNAITLNGPTMPTVAAGDIMATLMAALAANAGVAGAFGDGPTTPKFHADVDDPGCDLPYLVYSEAAEKPQRMCGFSAKIGNGSFELGVFDATKLGARQKCELVRACLDGLAMPQVLGDGGTLIYLRSQDNAGRDIQTTAPGTGVTEFGRTAIFDYQVTRPEP